MASQKTYAGQSRLFPGQEKGPASIEFRGQLRRHLGGAADVPMVF